MRVPTPPLKLLPLLAQDIPTYIKIQVDAFTSSHPRWPMLWPKGNTPQLYEYYSESTAATLSEPQSRMMKAVRGDRILAVAEWTFSPPGELEDEKEEEEKPRPENWPEGGNWEMRVWYARQWTKWRRERFGARGWICLDILVTDPLAQRQGAGTELLQWGVKQADSQGLPMCLEASPTGWKLYERHGFEVVKIVKKDMKDFGWREAYDEDAAARIWMVREPKGSSVA